MDIRAWKLRWVLVASGIGTLVILDRPQLVFWGYLLFIIPGLVLSVMPVVFGYGCAFGAARIGIRAWLDRHVVDPAPRLINGLAAVSALCLGLALSGLSQLEAKTRLAAHSLPSVQSAGKIPVRGDVRLELEHYGGRGCDGECKTLLQHPGVSSVTIASPPLTDFAMLHAGRINPVVGVTVRLRDADECRGAELEHDAVADRCLLESPPMQHYDLFIRQGEWREWNDSSRLSNWVLRRPVSIYVVEVRTANRVLARDWAAWTQAFTLPLSALPTCGATYETQLCWTRKTLGRNPNGSELQALSLLAI